MKAWWFIAGLILVLPACTLEHAPVAGRFVLEVAPEPGKGQSATSTAPLGGAVAAGLISPIQKSTGQTHPPELSTAVHGRQTPNTFRGLVVDTYGIPIPGASVQFGDGRVAMTNDDGVYQLKPPPGLGLVAASAPGFATSLVYDLSDIPTLHLRPTDRFVPAFERRSRHIRGSVAWPDGGHRGGIAYYEDSLGSTVAPAVVAPDGTFAFDVTLGRPGAARAVVLVLAGDDSSQLLMGATSTFEPHGEMMLPPVRLARADRKYSYALQGVPSELSVCSSRLELAHVGGPPIAITGMPLLAGQFSLPEEDWSLATRVVVEAQSPDSRYSVEAGIALTTSVTPIAALSVPEVVIDTAERQVTWKPVPGARGYRVALETASGPRWEAWTTTAVTLHVPAEAWPKPGTTDLVVEAVDAEDTSSFHVASLAPHRLRLIPGHEKATYRLSRCRFPM